MLSFRDVWLLLVLFLAAGSAVFLVLVWDFDFGIWGECRLALVFGQFGLIDIMVASTDF